MLSFLERYSLYILKIPLAGYWIILFILTSLPTGMALTTDFSDKVNHFGAYGLLSVLLYLNLKIQDKYKLLRKNAGTFTIIIASIYGMLDELHQMFVPGRSAEFWDWLADFSGSVVAVLILNIWYNYQNKSLEVKNI